MNTLHVVWEREEIFRLFNELPRAGFCFLNFKVGPSTVLKMHQLVLKMHALVKPVRARLNFFSYPPAKRSRASQHQERVRAHYVRIRVKVDRYQEL